MESNTVGQEKPKLIILTGPQGSGNHLWSKIFAMHPMIEGWRMQRYWEGHHHEPFAQYWDEPEKLKDYKPPENKKHFVTSISCPFFKDKKPHIPQYKKFIEEAEKMFDVKICILGRDPKILKLQQTRIRKEHTTKYAMEALESLWQYKPYILSMENFYLYRGAYLKRIGEDLDFPLAYNHKIMIDDYADKSSNNKYISAVDEQPLDKQVYQAQEES